jgi:hypothetical protein
MLALIVKLKLHPTECDRPHKLEIELWDGNGQRMGPKVDGEFKADRQPKARPGMIQMVLNFMGAEVPRPDDYEFHIMVDGQHRKTVPLYLERADDTRPPPAQGARAPHASES